MDWVLPDELSDFFVKHCSKFMPRKKRKALIEEKHKCNPPSNLMKAPKLDSFVTSTLAGKGLGKVSSIDKELVENFEQCSEIMGPLGKAWLAVENFRSEPSEETQIDIHQLALNLKVAVMMVGQSCHKITHSRRQNALKALSNDDLEQAKSLLKQNSDCLESETRKLFGEEFQNVLKATTKESKSTIEYFEHMESLKSGKGKGKGHGEKGKGKGKASWGTTVKPPIIPPFQGNLYANGSYGRGQQKFGAYQAMGRGQQQNKGGYRGGFRGGYGTPPWKSGKKIKSIKFRISPFAKNPNTREISPSLCKVDPSANKKRGSVKNWGEDLVLSKKLEEADQGQSYLGHGPRIPNSTCGKASSNQKTSRHKHECGRKMGSDGRDSKNAYKRCGRSNHTRAGPVFKQRVCKAKARKQTQGDIKPERTKQMCQVSPFQDGDHKRHKTSFAGRRLSDKDRPSGCILECPSESRIKKTDAVRMGGDYVRVQDPGLRPRTCTSSLYQIDEDPNLPDEEVGIKANDISGRYTISSTNPLRSISGQGHIDISPRKFRSDSELEKIHSRASPHSRVPGHDNQHIVNDHISPREKNQGTSETLQRETRKKGTLIEGNESINRQAVFYSSSYNSSTSPIEVLTTRPHKSPEGGSELLRHNNTFQRLQEGVGMVDFQLETTGGKVSPDSRTRNGNLLRCCENPGVGSSDGRGPLNEWTMVNSREDLQYKRIGVDGGGTRHKGLCKDQACVKSTFMDRQPGSSDLLNENGGYQKRNTNQNFQKYLGISFGQRDHTYCKLDPFQNELEGRPGVQEKAKLQRLVSTSGNFPENSASVGHTHCGLLRVANYETSAQLHESKLRLREQRDKRHVPDMAHRVPLPVSPFLPDRAITAETKKRTSGKSHPHSSTMVGTGMVSKSFGNGDRSSTTLGKQGRHADRHRGSATSIGDEPDPSFGSIPGLRESYEAKGLSKRATFLLLGSKREGTTNVYAGHWKKWNSWCSKREANPFNCHINLVIDYIAELFDKGLEYRTIGVIRSAISAYHIPVEGFKVGEHPLVKDAMSGVDIKRPPKPKYCVIWDVEKVLNFFRKQPDDGKLSLRMLTHKAAMLLALAAVSRGSELKMLNIKYMAESDTKLVFYFTQPPKHWRKKGVSPKPLEIRASGMNLCPVKTTKSYIVRTTIHRGENSQLFIGTVKPHKPVTRATIGR